MTAAALRIAIAEHPQYAGQQLAGRGVTRAMLLSIYRELYGQEPEPDAEERVQLAEATEVSKSLNEVQYQEFTNLLLHMAALRLECEMPGILSTPANCDALHRMWLSGFPDFNRRLKDCMLVLVRKYLAGELLAGIEGFFRLAVKILRNDHHFGAIMEYTIAHKANIPQLALECYAQMPHVPKGQAWWMARAGERAELLALVKEA